MPPKPCRQHAVVTLACRPVTIAVAHCHVLSRSVAALRALLPSHQILAAVCSADECSGFWSKSQERLESVDSGCRRHCHSQCAGLYRYIHSRVVASSRRWRTHT